MRMGDTYAITGLRRKRAHIAGEVEAAEQTLARKREELAIIDATIQLFAPDSHPDLIPSIRPTRHGMFFRRGEQHRFCLAALREAGRPLTVRQITVYAMEAKGLPTGNDRIVILLTRQVRMALVRLERKGLVRKIVQAPDAWWELAGAD